MSGRHQSFNAAALSFLTAVTIAGEHLYKANSTAAVALSLAIALVSDWNRIQAYASHPMPYYLQKLAISAFTLKCMLVALDELPKQLNTEDSSDDATPKADTTQHGTAGFWSRTLLSGFSTQPVETPVQASQPLTSPEAISTNPQNKFWDLGMSDTTSILGSIHSSKSASWRKILLAALEPCSSYDRASAQNSGASNGSQPVYAVTGNIFQALLHLC